MSLTSRHRTEDSRSAILRAAIEEFAELGESGGRMDAIARAAGVNKALLHYYFGTKEALYEAALDQVLLGLKESYLGILQGPGTAGERVLRYVLSQFDRLASTQGYARLLGHEMIRIRSGHSKSTMKLAQTYHGPLHAAFMNTLEEGIGTGEFIPCNPRQTALSITGANIFYFASEPIFREIVGRETRDPEQLVARRRAILEMVAALLFTNRKTGFALAERLLAKSLPSPVHPERKRSSSSRPL